MSGLFGYFGPTPVGADAGSDALAVARAMGAAQSHTARQRAQTAQAGHDGALGRISIGLFNQAPQPLALPGGAGQLWFCGELYHQEARRRMLAQSDLLPPEADDAALARALFLHEGSAGLTTLEGAFIVAVWEATTRTLTLINDRYGLYPHYYCLAGRAFAFAPEIKGVLAAPGMPRRLDMVAVAEYTRFQQLLEERTWLEDVHLLPPATVLHYNAASGSLRMARYWDWDAIKPAPSMRFAEAAEETGRLFQRAIDAMIKPPLRLSVYLSGGLDGRTILGYIPPQIDVTAITYGQAGCRDVVYGAALARRARRPQRWFPFTDGKWVLENTELHLALTEGMHSWMHAHGISTLAEASTLADVNLSGWDGGTLLGGRIGEYATDALLRHAPSEAALAERFYDNFCHTFAWPGLSDAEAELLFSAPGSPQLRGLARASLTQALARTAHYPAPYRADFFYIAQHVRRSTQAMIVFQRAAMEVRCPYFDYAFVDFLYGLPEQILAGPALHRAVLTRRAPGLARIANEKDERLPHSNPLLRNGHATWQRAQRGVRRAAARLGGPPPAPPQPRLYADYENYLRTDLRAWAAAILFDERTHARGLFNPAVVRSLWQRHLDAAELWTIGKIAPLITIELSLRALLDAPHSSAPSEEVRAVAR